MSDEARGSLADAVADWTPPWQRKKTEQGGDADTAAAAGEGGTGTGADPGDAAAATGGKQVAAGERAGRDGAGGAGTDAGADLAEPVPAAESARLAPRPAQDAEAGTGPEAPATAAEATASTSQTAVSASDTDAAGAPEAGVRAATADTSTGAAVSAPETAPETTVPARDADTPDGPAAPPASTAPSAPRDPAQDADAGTSSAASDTTARPDTDHAPGTAVPAPPAEPPPHVDDLPATLEAILMIVDEPVGEIMLAQILDRPAEEIATALQTLSTEYTEQGRGFDLRKQAGGWRFYTRDEYAAHVERFVLDGQQARLTKAALETLAVVAYKQPVTRARISGIRGVNCDGVIRTLLSRGLVEECGAEPDTGAHLYRTTVLFLEKLGINSISELPPLAPFLPDDLDDLTDGGVDE